MTKWVAYYRVSTAKQGASGLGLEAQRVAVAAHLSQAGGELVEELTEVESGRSDNRMQLDAALTLCRLYGARLVVAKMDRLSRNVAFTSRLMQDGVDFVACDNPHATRFTIHILAAVAEHEAGMISARTRAALTAAKARGVQLGVTIARNRTAEGATRGSIMGNTTLSAAADRFALDLRPQLDRLRREGAVSLRDLAAGLNEKGIPTARGKKWAAASVRAVVARIELVGLQATPVDGFRKPSKT